MIQMNNKTKMEIILFFVLALEPIKIQTCSSSQYDRLNLTFVKDLKVETKKKRLEMFKKRTFVSDNNYETDSTFKE